MVDVKTVAQLVADVKYEFTQEIDAINDMNVGSALDMFATAICQRLNELYDELQTLEDNAFVDTSAGTYLDQLGKEAGITRSEGDNATGYVTFLRSSPATTSFTIPNSTQVSTQPNSSEAQLLYNTTTAATFNTSVSNASISFANGIYKYKMGARFVDSVSNVDGTASAAAFTFTEGTDFDIEEVENETLLDSDSLTIIDDCETADWALVSGTAGVNPTLNSTTYWEDSNSLNIMKTSTTATNAAVDKTLGSAVDLSEYKTFVYVYIKDATELAKLDDIDIYLGNSGITNSYLFNFAASTISIGWNLLELDYSASTTTVNGSANISTINYIRFIFNTVNATDTLSAGDCMMDMWCTADSESYTGDVIAFDVTGTIPDDSTDVEYDYVPLSVDVLCQAQSVGDDYNVTANSIVYKVSNLTNIDTINNYSAFTGGIDIETDDAYRTRITSSRALNDVATVDALEANILALSFVKSVTITDTPLTTASEESFVFSTSNDYYTLSSWIAQDTATLVISDTSGGTADYVKDTDYELTDDNQIHWLGATEPANGATFYVVAYDYNKVGYFDVLVTGITGTLSTAQITEIEDLIDDKKSAGIQYVVTQPTNVTATVTATVTVLTGYTAATVKTNVSTAIDSYIEALEIGEDVLLAEIIAAAMDVDGVSNIASVQINAASSDLSISSTQIAINGTHVIS